MTQDQLIPGKEYRIKYTGQFCHAYTSKGRISLDRDKTTTVTFVGSILTISGPRNIFYSFESTYYMFDTENLDYIIDENSIKEEIESLKQKISELENKLK